MYMRARVASSIVLRHCDVPTARGARHAFLGDRYMQIYKATVSYGVSKEKCLHGYIVKEANLQREDRMGRSVCSVQRLQALHRQRYRRDNPRIVTYKVIVAKRSSQTTSRRNMFAASSVQAVVMTRFRCSLDNFQYKVRSRLCHTERWRLMAEIAKAVNDAHDGGVAHCNLCLEHILLRFAGTVAVTGWGSSRTGATSSTVATSAPHGSPLFQAPEVQACARAGNACQHQYRVFAADVWSLGMVAVYISTPVLWHTLFSRVTAATDIGEAAIRKQTTLLLEATRGVCDEHMASIIRRALDPNPASRASATEITALVSAGADAAAARRNRDVPTVLAGKALQYDKMMQAKEEEAAQRLLVAVTLQPHATAGNSTTHMEPAAAAAAPAAAPAAAEVSSHTAPHHLLLQRTSHSRQIQAVGHYAQAPSRPPDCRHHRGPVHHYQHARTAAHMPVPRCTEQTTISTYV